MAKAIRKRIRFLQLFHQNLYRKANDEELMETDCSYCVQRQRCGDTCSSLDPFWLRGSTPQPGRVGIRLRNIVNSLSEKVAVSWWQFCEYQTMCTFSVCIIKNVWEQ